MRFLFSLFRLDGLSNISHAVPMNDLCISFPIPLCSRVLLVKSLDLSVLALGSFVYLLDVFDFDFEFFFFFFTGSVRSNCMRNDLGR